MEYNMINDKDFIDKCEMCEEILKKHIDSLEVDDSANTINNEIQTNHSYKNN